MTTPGSPPHVSSPSVISTTVRDPVTELRSELTARSASAIGVRVFLPARRLLTVDRAVARSSGPSGSDNVVWQRCSRPFPLDRNVRRATGTPSASPSLMSD